MGRKNHRQSSQAIGMLDLSRHFLECKFNFGSKPFKSFNQALV